MKTTPVRPKGRSRMRLVSAMPLVIIGIYAACVSRAADTGRVEQKAESIIIISGKQSNTIAVTRRITPLQIGLGYFGVPWHMDEVRGLSLGFGGPTYVSVYGLALGLAHFANHVSGVQVSLVNGVNSLAGLQISLQCNGGLGSGLGLLGGPGEQVSLHVVQGPTAGEVSGIQLCGWANRVGGHMNGLQLAGCENIVLKDMSGIQMSLLQNWAGRIAGLQIGCYNLAGVGESSSGQLHGLQLGILNRAKEVSGVQMGVVNYTEILHGIQIGIANIATEAPLPFFPILNAHF